MKMFLMPIIKKWIYGLSLTMLTVFHRRNSETALNHSRMMNLHKLWKTYVQQNLNIWPAIKCLEQEDTY